MDSKHGEKRAFFKTGTIGKGVVCLMLILSFCFGSLAHAATKEYQVKAAFLFNFTQFVQWPDLESQPQFNLCVLGAHSFGDILNDLETKNVKGKSIKIRYLESPASLETCQILFISRAGKRFASEVLPQLGGKPVLIVGESSGFAKEGAMINFTIEESKVRFEINQKTAESAGLKMSSQLLKLAATVVASMDENAIGAIEKKHQVVSNKKWESSLKI